MAEANRCCSPNIPWYPSYKLKPRLEKTDCAISRVSLVRHIHSQCTFRPEWQSLCARLCRPREPRLSWHLAPRSFFMPEEMRDDRKQRLRAARLVTHPSRKRPEKGYFGSVCGRGARSANYKSTSTNSASTYASIRMLRRRDAANSRNTWQYRIELCHLRPVFLPRGKIHPTKQRNSDASYVTIERAEIFLVRVIM